MLFKIGNYLNKIGCLNQIDESNRKKYGVTKHEFGDLIYVLKMDIILTLIALVYR